MSSHWSISDTSDMHTIPVLTESMQSQSQYPVLQYKKGMVDGIATIKVPVQYEEIFVNGKKFGSRVSSLGTAYLH